MMCFILLGGVWVELMLDFLEWLRTSTRFVEFDVITHVELSQKVSVVSTRSFGSVLVSVRDVLTWVRFMNHTSSSLTEAQSFVHGAYLVFLDSLGCGGSAIAIGGGATLKKAASAYVSSLLERGGADCKGGEAGGDGVDDLGEFRCEDGRCGIPPFWIPSGEEVGVALGVANMVDGESSALLKSKKTSRKMSARDSARVSMSEGDKQLKKLFRAIKDGDTNLVRPRRCFFACLQ